MDIEEGLESLHLILGEFGGRIQAHLMLCFDQQKIVVPLLFQYLNRIRKLLFVCA